MSGSVKRNVFILVGFVLFVVAGFVTFWPSSLPVQSISKIGVVSYGGAHNEVIIGLKQGMEKLGYVEGEQILYLIVDAEGSEENVRAATDHFLAEGVDVIYSATTPITRTVQSAVTDIPIVFNIVSDPVGVGFANSMLSSGTNLTGCSNAVGQTGPKRLEILKTILPDASNVLVVYDAQNKFSQDAMVILRDAAKTLEVELSERLISSKEDVIQVMDDITPGEYDAFFHLGEAKVSGAASDVIERANAVGLPTFAHSESFAELGMLATYGPSWRDLGEQCADIVDKVLRGALPTEIPIQLPEKLDLVINLGTMEQLGVEISNDILISTDKFIK